MPGVKFSSLLYMRKVNHLPIPKTLVPPCTKNSNMHCTCHIDISHYAHGMLKENDSDQRLSLKVTGHQSEDACVNK